MSHDLEILLRDGQPVERCIGHVLNLSALETDEMVMKRHVCVEARPFMSYIDLPREAGLSQHPQRVIDGVARDHGMPALHSLIQIIRRGMTR